MNTGLENDSQEIWLVTALSYYPDLMRVDNVAEPVSDRPMTHLR
jgi:hypothetical protein